ncbi:unnamed protein product [Meganyctiphanes norvegica]|uniref:Uncharacterized protein n=1 Tax=Meganyctiphanes norvegica TaxID=48144 RepID=A0AAV2S815_MEGNR
MDYERLHGSPLIDTHLRKNLMEILNPNTSPEMALKSFSSFCFSPNARERNNEYRLVFIVHVKFIMTRLTDQCVTGIWENIIKKTIMYSRMFYPSENAHIVKNYMGMGFVERTLSPTELQVANWFNEALSSTSKCPNSYVRLGLFRLIRILLEESLYLPPMPWECICATFIQTIVEIQPHRIYSNTNVDEMLFEVCDMHHMIRKCSIHGKLENIISNNKVANNKETMFILHSLQLVRVFAIVAGSIADSKGFINKRRVQEIFNTQLNVCCSVLNSIGPMVTMNNPIIGQSQGVICHPLFHPYFAETVCDLTSAIINNKVCETNPTLNPMGFIKYVAEELGVCTKTCDLPRLLLHRQMYGFNPLVRQHSLLLRYISPLTMSDSDGNPLTIRDSDGNKRYWI